jgi:very-short-patch-repair endonuclease
MDDPTASVFDLAARQYGAVARRQALALGLSRDRFRSLVRSGRLLRVDAATYVVPGSPATWERRVLVALLATDPEAAASHLAAAHLHGLIARAPAVIDVTVRHGTQDGRPQGAARVHRARSFDRADVKRVANIPVTCVERTLVDVAGLLTVRALGAALDKALLSREVTIADVRSYMSSRHLMTRRGAGSLRRLLADREGGVPESELEREFLDLVARWALPVPVRQKVVGPFRVDFAYPEARVLIELDGRAWHGSVQAFDDDPIRQNALMLEGWAAVLRFTWRHLKDKPRYVADTVTAVVLRAG